jgi:hypothetical protein
VGKYLIGFANRDPDTAARVVGGCAYLVLGVEPGRTVGIERLDTASLQDAISRFVDGSRVRWNPTFVEFEDRIVLVIEVMPPRPGDKIASLLTQFQDERGKTWNGGSIFVRRNGQTEMALPREIDMLVERASGGLPEPQITLAGGGHSTGEAVVRLRPEPQGALPYQPRLAVLAEGYADSPVQPFRDRAGARGWWAETWFKVQSSADRAWNSYNDGFGREYPCPLDAPTGKEVWVVLTYEFTDGTPSSIWQRFSMTTGGSWGIGNPIAPPIRLRGVHVTQ